MKTVELVPNPVYLIQSMRCIGYTLDTALADIIDNSIAACASRVSVCYQWENGKPWLAILDNGYGMSEKELYAAMRFGGDASPLAMRNDKDLGRFGLGLKTASLSQCKKMTVISKHGDGVFACAWDVDFLANIKSMEWSAIVPSLSTLNNDIVIKPLLNELLNNKKGTVVVWQNIDAIISDERTQTSECHFSEIMSLAAEHVRIVFHRFLVLEGKSKAIQIDFNGTLLEPFNPFGEPRAARRELRSETVSVGDAKITVQPYVLPHYSKTSKQDYGRFGGEEGYLQNQGFYVYRNRRLIVKGTWFRLVPKTELTKLIRVQVDIPTSLDHLWQLDVKKSQAHPPQIVLDRLREIIQRIASEGRAVYTRRSQRPIANMIHVWRREISDGQVSYVINEEHPFVKSLVSDSAGGVDRQKLSYLRIISGAFPVDVFHVDANSDHKVEIVSPAKKDEMIAAVVDFIRLLINAGLDEAAVKVQLAANELPVSEEELNELIKKELYG